MAGRTSSTVSTPSSTWRARASPRRAGATNGKPTFSTSRIAATRSLVTAIARAAAAPRVLVSASGVGYYGPRGAEIITEATPPGTDFLAKVCVEWEREAEQASTVTRVAIVRTGLALHPEGGALARMLLPFKLGAGGPLGAGTQYMPWIHRDDWVDLVRWLIAEPGARGAFNGTAPEPVTNAEFVRALGRALGRPAILPVPAFGLRLLFGEMADLLLSGQRAVPARALEMGFRFRFEKLEKAFEDLLSGAARASRASQVRGLKPARHLMTETPARRAGNLPAECSPNCYPTSCR